MDFIFSRIEEVTNDQAIFKSRQKYFRQVKQATDGGVTIFFQDIIGEDICIRWIKEATNNGYLFSGLTVKEGNNMSSE